MTIKFRGIAEDGKHIFSNSIDFEVDGKGREFCRLKDEFGNWIYVDPDSVAQFVGYDAEGKEVYEGDKLNHVDDEDYNAIAYIETYIGVKSGTIADLLDIHSSKFFSENNSKFWKLKGRGENENLS